MITPTLIRAITITLCGIVFMLVMGFAVRSGYRRAQSSILYDNTGQLSLALEYFKQDNNRYPSTNEFTDQNSFGRYLNGFPLKPLTSGICNNSYQYVLINPLMYELDVCLPVSVESLPAGVQKIKP